jgi:hypothetical protein
MTVEGRRAIWLTVCCDRRFRGPNSFQVGIANLTKNTCTYAVFYARESYTGSSRCQDHLRARQRKPRLQGGARAAFLWSFPAKVYRHLRGNRSSSTVLNPPARGWWIRLPRLVSGRVSNGGVRQTAALRRDSYGPWMVSSCGAEARRACAGEVGSRGSPPVTFTLVALTRSSHHNAPAAAPAASF